MLGGSCLFTPSFSCFVFYRLFYITIAKNLNVLNVYYRDLKLLLLLSFYYKFDINT